MRRPHTVLLLLALLFAQPAFAKNKYMSVARDQDPGPQSEKAMVVFLRAGFMGGKATASVYDGTDDRVDFLGILYSGDRLAVQVEPGFHRFMAYAENADFLDATLEAGKRYYILVRARPGIAKARFSLIPFHPGVDAEYSLQGKDFRSWYGAATFVERTAAADAWYDEHREDVAKKKAIYLVKWNAMSPEDRAVLTLRPEDGVTALP